MGFEEYIETALGDLDDESKVRFLLSTAKEFSDLADRCKKDAYDLMRDIKADKIEYEDGKSISIHSRTTKKVDTGALRVLHPEIYKQICEMGKVNVSYSDIKDFGLDDCVTLSYSSYAGFDRE